MKRIPFFICNFLTLASTVKITACEPEVSIIKPVPPAPVKSMAERNREAIYDDITSCLTLAHIARLKTVLGLCASDFSGDQLVHAMAEIEAREEMLKIIDQVYGDVPAKFSDMMCEMPYATFDELQILMVYCKRYQKRFSLLERQEIEIQYKRRMERLASPS